MHKHILRHIMKKTLYKMQKRTTTQTRLLQNLPSLNSAVIANRSSNTYDLLNNLGLIQANGKAIDISMQTNFLPTGKKINSTIKTLQSSTLREILQLALPEVLTTPFGKSLESISQSSSQIIESHIDFSQASETNQEILYYPQSPYFYRGSCSTKEEIIYRNCNLFQTNIIEQIPRSVNNQNTLDLISQTRQRNLTGITLEEWILSYLYERMFNNTSNRFNNNEIIFETVLPKTQECIYIHFDQTQTPHLIPINKQTPLSPNTFYRQSVLI